MSWTHLRQLDERGIRYFMVVCEERSVRGAAERLRIAASAIARKLKELEADFGIPLLSRTNRGLAPTALGSILLQHLVKRHEDDADVIAKLLELSRLKQGEIKIGIGEAFLGDLINSALLHCMERHPELRFELLVRNTEQIVKALERDEIEIGIAFNPPPMQNAIEVFQRRSPIGCTMPPNWTHFGDAPLSLMQLVDVPCALLSREFSVRRLIDDAERAAGIRLRVIVETNSLYALKQFVQAGLGMTILPDISMLQETRCGIVRQVPIAAPGFEEARVKTLVSNFGKDHPPTLELLKTMVTEMDLARDNLLVDVLSPLAVVGGSYTNVS